MKIVDRFVWKVVTDKAKELHNTGMFALYVLNGDGSESLVVSSEDLNLALEEGKDIAIEVGYLPYTEDEIKLIEKSRDGYKGVYWSVNDFETRTNDLDSERYDSSKFQTALDKMVKNHDMSNGITWEVVDYYLEECCLKD